MANAFLFALTRMGQLTENKMNELPHIGELIRAELHRQGRSNAWLAQQLACHPRTVGKIFQKDIIDTRQLLIISKALQYDFFKHYSDLVG